MKKYIARAEFIFSLFLFVATSTYGTIYYVAKNGYNTNPGTEAQPWLTIQKAADTLIAGDTVYIKTGIYSERVIPQNSGAHGNYITYLAYPGDTITIDGTGISLPEWGGLFDISDRNYIKISGFRIINVSSNYHNTGILVDNSSHIIIEKNYTYNTVSSGIAAWYSSNIIIDSNEVELACNNGEQECITVAITDTFEVKNNYVHHGGPGSMGGEGIDVKDGSSNGKVYKNYVHDMNRLGIYVDAWDKHTYNIDVFQNIVHNCTDGFDVASEAGGLLENVRLYNNIAYNNKNVGIWIVNWGEPVPEHPMKDIKVINNTLYNNGEEWGGGIMIMNSDAKNVVIRNNLCSQNLSFQIALEDTPPTNLVVDHNLIDGYMGYWGEIYGRDSVVGNPDFISPSVAGFHLQEDSPAIDKGSSIYAPNDDFDGNPRPQGAGYDIGAFEYTEPGIEEKTISSPKLSTQVYPNPCNELLAISYQLPVKSKVSLKIFDVCGKMIETLVGRDKEAGHYIARWNAKEHPSGVYFCRFKDSKSVITKKFVIMR
ncbi:right-handed parallel beta-helix repeat-containing protein [candidate division WOR-3 bacterium]|nr:right-handed parallel beta-helix repeat-containing protein [candidate division WOR-3 bacterium]